MKYIKTYNEALVFPKKMEGNINDMLQQLGDVCLDLSDEGYHVFIWGSDQIKSEDVIRNGFTLSIRKMDVRDMIEKYDAKNVIETISHIKEFLQPEGFYVKEIGIDLGKKSIMSGVDRFIWNAQRGGFNEVNYVNIYIKPFNKIKEEFSKTYVNVNKTYDFFKDKVNWELINSLKDMSLDYLDEGHQLIYSINVDSDEIQKYTIILGYFKTRDSIFRDDLPDWERRVAVQRDSMIPKDYYHWTDFYPEHLEKVIRYWEESKGLLYGFGIMEQSTEARFGKRDVKAQMEILSRMKSMYPDETIYITK